MSARGTSPFSRVGVLALLLVGFGVFGALLYFIGVGDPGLQDSQNGRAHAAAKGLNGYSALVKLVEADGVEVELSRENAGLTTDGTLVLTPPHSMKPEDLTDIIEARQYLGSTLVILPKWNALPSQFLNQLESPEKAQRGWVVLGNASAPRWANEESGLLALGVAPAWTLDPEDESASITTSVPVGRDEQAPTRFSTAGSISGISGQLPNGSGFAADTEQPHFPLVVDEGGHTLALTLNREDAYPITFIIEPDLVNNWGLADSARAQTALAIIRSTRTDGRVTFDLTTNGFGGTLNLLTFAFRPPFLAATICLCLATLILAWRAFFRFGPPIARARQTALGKAQLVTNGADLIVRGKRLNLLAQPYAALRTRRVARHLGLRTTDPAEIGAALAALGENDGAFASAAQRLKTAAKPDTILSAARALYALSSKANSRSQGTTDT